MSRPSAAPITQRDVALACGVSASTICLALQNAPSIPPATRERIHAKALELGYQPNAAARNLALLRTDKKDSVRLPLAWINQEPRRDFWRSDPAGAVIFSGAKVRAAKLGYYLDEFWTQEPHLSAPRLVQILRARGMEGVVLPVHRQFDAEFVTQLRDNFSTVALNDHRLGQWVDTVCPDYYHNTAALLGLQRSRGYERIGLVLDDEFDAATNGLPHSCYLRHQNHAGHGSCLPVCYARSASGPEFDAVRRWYFKHRPDLVICRDAALAAWWPQAGLPVELVQLQFRSGADGFSGFDERVEDVAATAIERLCGKIQRFEKGPRQATHLHLVKGAWAEPAAARCRPQTVAA